MNPITSIIPRALGNFPTLTFENLQDVVATSAGIGTEQPPFLQVPKAENSAIATSLPTNNEASLPLSPVNLDLKWNSENLTYHLPTVNNTIQPPPSALALAVPTFTDWQTNWQATFNTASQAVSMKSFQLAPNIVDPNVTDTAAYFAVVDKSVAAVNKLFLFLPGTGAQALLYEDVAREAAHLGYHVLNLNYINTDAVASLCVTNSDPNSYENVRLEVLDGIDRTSLIDVNPANSIQNRLIKTLQYLDAQNPGQGWGQYLQGSSPLWQKMVVAGHSQGGAQAAIIGKQHQVDRVVMFAPGNDYSATINNLAPWISKAGATSAGRYYGFKNINDTATGTLQQTYQMWTQLGMDAFGSAINVDIFGVNLTQSHTFITGLTSSNDAHNTLVTDNTTFFQADGTPVYSDVWQYLLASDITTASGVNYNNQPTITGTPQNDTLIGSDWNDIMSGGDGNDVITDEGGNDIIDGGNGDDQLFASPGGNLNESDIVNGRAGNDTINGSDGGDMLFGDAGNDTINGHSGNDQIDGGTGNNTIQGEDGNDTIVVTGSTVTNNLDGGNGDDSITGGTGADNISGDNGNDLINGGSGDDNLSGNDGNDTINGGDGNDLIDGGTGNDTLSGGNGNDVLNANSGSNILNGGAGTDTLNFNNPNVTAPIVADLSLGTIINVEVVAGVLNFTNQIKGSTNTETISGGNLNDVLNGNGGNDVISGGGGDDQITGGSGNDTLTGNDGNDTIISGDGANTVDGGNGNDNITGGAGVDNLTGGAGDDVINGMAGNDIINGGDGNDIIDGGAGNNTLSGGNGNDVLNANSGSNILDGGAGTDTLNFNNPNVTAPIVADLSLGTIVNFEVISGALNFTNQIKGSINTETMSGGNLNDVLNGNGGNDVISGGAGDDQITGVSGNDILTGNDGNDTINTGDGTNTVDGGNGNDNITGGAGIDSLTGGAGNDFINGAAGNDTLNGGDGNDTLNGGDGNDTIVGSNGNDIIDGGLGKDTLSYSGMTVGVTVNLGSSSAVFGGYTQTLSNFEVVLGATNFNNQLTGGSAVDSLLGGNLDDTLSGAAGNDVLTGNGGNDILVGGAGTDMLTGGTGVDRFTFNSLTENSDNITDFTVSQLDQIVVSAAGFKGGLVAGTPLSTAQLVLGTAATQGIGQFIYNSATGKLSFDADGTGTGLATQIAILTTKPVLGTSSFTIIA